jgi:hypothetical protein
MDGINIDNKASKTLILFTADRHLDFDSRPHMRIQLCLVGKMHFQAVHFVTLILGRAFRCIPSSKFRCIPVHFAHQAQAQLNAHFAKGVLDQLGQHTRHWADWPG